MGPGRSRFAYILHTFCRRPSYRRVLRSLPGLKNYQSCLSLHSGCRWQRIKQKGRLVGSCPSMAAEKLALDGTEPETQIPLGCLLPTARCLYFHFFLSNWSSVCVGGEGGRCWCQTHTLLMAQWAETNKKIGFSLIFSFQHRINNLNHTFWAIQPPLIRSLWIKESYQKRHTLGPAPWSGGESVTRGAT